MKSWFSVCFERLQFIFDNHKFLDNIPLKVATLWIVEKVNLYLHNYCLKKVFQFFNGKITDPVDPVDSPDVVRGLWTALFSLSDCCHKDSCYFEYFLKFYSVSTVNLKKSTYRELSHKTWIDRVGSRAKKVTQVRQPYKN